MEFIHPSTILVSGPTGSGKSVFVAKLIELNYFNPPPNNIIWVYNEWQPLYEKLNKSIKFLKGGDMSILEKLYNEITPDLRNLIILDDQMNNKDSSNTIEKLFTQGSHHRNLTVIYLVQNLFDKGKGHRSISLNSQYMILFKNPRDKAQIDILSRQMFPNQSKFLTSAFEHATRKSYSYLVIDLRPDTPEELRIRTKIFPDQVPVVYNPI